MVWDELLKIREVVTYLNMFMVGFAVLLAIVCVIMAVLLSSVNSRLKTLEHAGQKERIEEAWQAQFRNPNSKHIRAGFTTIELLVVTAIIGILVGLILSAVMMVRSSQYTIEAKKSVDDMHVALTRFMTYHGLKKIPPNRLLLSNDRVAYQPSSLGGHPSGLGPSSAAFLRTVWTRLDLENEDYDWSMGRIPGKYAEVLDGNQVLVFLLGSRFHASKNTPVKSSNPLKYLNPERTPLLYNFTPSYLYFPPGTVSTSAKFAVYLDPWDEPYLYRSNGEILSAGPDRIVGTADDISSFR